MTNATDTTPDFNAELNQALVIFGEVFDRLLASTMTNEKKTVVQTLVGRVSVEFNNGFTSRLGDATPSLRRVRLSAPLWARATVAERRETVIHELAHVVTWSLFPRASAHGNEWRWVMALSGGIGARTHSVDRSGLKKAGGTFSCGCRVFTMGSTRSARIRKGRTYTCQKCRGTLVEVAVMACESSTVERAYAPASACRPRFQVHSTPVRPTAPSVAPTAPVATTATTATTTEAIVAALRSGTPYTVAELAKFIGKSPCATNRYARRLVAEGRVTLTEKGGKVAFCRA